MARAKTVLVRVETDSRNRLRKYCKDAGVIMRRICSIAIDEYVARNTVQAGSTPRRRKGDKAA